MPREGVRFPWLAGKGPGGRSEHPPWARVVASECLRGAGLGARRPCVHLFSPSAITEAHASAGPGRGTQGGLISMVCVAGLAAHHVPLTEDTGRGTEGRGRVRAVGPSFQSPDVPTVASAS